MLETEVVLVSERDQARWVYLDAGLFTGLVEAIDESIRFRIEVHRDGAALGGPVGPVVLAGPTCDSLDVLYERYRYLLSLDLGPGDRLTFRRLYRDLLHRWLQRVRAIARGVSVRRSAAPAEPTFRTALREYDFRLLLAGHGAGTIAQLVLTLAVGIEVLERTSSSLWVSVTVALGFAPYVIFSGYAGLLADRWSRSTILTWSFITRGGCAAVLAAGLLLGWPVPLLVLVAAVAAVLATPSYPALAAAIPQCVPDEQLTPANALVTAVENVSWMAGPGVLGLILLASNGPGLATVVAAGLLAGAGCLTARARLPRPAVDAGPGAESAAESTGPGLWDGLRIVAMRARVRRPMTVAVIDNFLYGYLVVAMVLLAERMFDGALVVGWFNAGLSIGALAAMAVINRLAAHRRPAPLLFAVMTVFAVATGLVGLSPWAPVLSCWSPSPAPPPWSPR